jgi:hypothetical protein
MVGLGFFFGNVASVYAYTCVISHQTDSVRSGRVSGIVTSLRPHLATRWPFPDGPHTSDHGRILKRAVPRCIDGEIDVGLVLDKRIDPATREWGKRGMEMPEDDHLTC